VRDWSILRIRSGEPVLPRRFPVWKPPGVRRFTRLSPKTGRIPGSWFGRKPLSLLKILLALAASLEVNDRGRRSGSVKTITLSKVLPQPTD
jgi:hypothetical protein